MHSTKSIKQHNAINPAYASGYEITTTNSTYSKFETEKVYNRQQRQRPPSTGSEIEAEEDAKAAHCYHAARVKPDARQMPVFLRSAPRLQASVAHLPPPVDETVHKAIVIISQPLSIAQHRLVPSIETPQELILPIHSTRCQRALRVHIVSSPIYEVQFVCSPPAQIIESLRLNRSQKVAELLVSPPAPQRAVVLDQVWQQTIFAVAYGKHAAVGAAIPRTIKQRVQIVPSNKKYGRMASVRSVMPQAPVEIKKLVLAPTKHVIELCCIDSNADPRQIKEIYIEEREFRVKTTTELSYSTESIVEFRR